MTWITSVTSLRTIFRPRPTLTGDMRIMAGRGQRIGGEPRFPPMTCRPSAAARRPMGRAPRGIRRPTAGWRAAIRRKAARCQPTGPNTGPNTGPDTGRRRAGLPPSTRRPTTGTGVSPNLAEAVVWQISAEPERAVATHMREELGIDPDDLPSPETAAAAAFAAFTVGALIPLSPFLLGFPVLSVALGVSAAAAFIGGAALAKLTGKSMFLGGLRQFTAAFLATGAAYGIGHLISGHVS
jgi:hypothetical protein